MRSGDLIIEVVEVPLGIQLSRQVVPTNTKGVPSFSPGLPFTATPGNEILGIMNSNGVPAWVGWQDGIRDDPPAHEGRNHFVVRVVARRLPG